jgi:ketosteroid isomerase-like protein
MRKLVTIINCLLAISPLQAGPADDVRCREIGFSLAAEARDGERFVSFIDADARFVGAAVTRGPEEIGLAWSVFFEPGGPTIKWRPKIVEVLEDGKLALSRGPFRVNSRNEAGDEIESWGTFNSVWRLNVDGTWRVVFDAGNAAERPMDEETRAFLDQDVGCPAATG